VLKGLQGEVVVNKETYNGVMPMLNLSDEDAANVMTYILNSWGNKGGEVTPAEIKKER
jgi:nitrite reductase (NO-forming)